MNSGLPYFGAGGVGAYGVGAHDVDAFNAGVHDVGAPGVGAHVVGAHNFGVRGKTPYNIINSSKRVIASSCLTQV